MHFLERPINSSLTRQGPKCLGADGRFLSDLLVVTGHVALQPSVLGRLSSPHSAIGAFGATAGVGQTGETHASHATLRHASHATSHHASRATLLRASHALAGLMTGHSAPRRDSRASAAFLREPLSRLVSLFNMYPDGTWGSAPPNATAAQRFAAAYTRRFEGRNALTCYVSGVTLCDSIGALKPGTINDEALRRARFHLTHR